jgi:hypothetical protein
MSVNLIGAKLAIATGRPATLDKAGYEALTWVEAAAGTVSIGAIGDTNETITVPDLTTGRNTTIKGAVTGDTVNIALSRQRLSTGAMQAAQAAFQAAAQAMGGEYSIRVVEAGTTGPTHYFTGAPMNWKNTEMTTTSYAGFTFDVAINTPPLVIYPTTP